MSFVSFPKKTLWDVAKAHESQIGYSFILFATLHGQNVSVLSQNVWIKYTSLQKQPKTHALEGQKPCAYQCLITFWIKSPWQPPKRNTEIIKSPQVSPKLPEIMPRPMPRPMPRCKETVLSCPPKANSSLSSTLYKRPENMMPGQEFDHRLWRIYIWELSMIWGIYWDIDGIYNDIMIYIYIWYNG